MLLQHFDQQTSRLKLSGLKNGQNSGRPLIALHGWLDNAASFIPLAHEIETTRPFYALELPGHGLSEHRPAACSYHLAENILDVVAFISALDQAQPVDLIGHSLGGIIASLVAAAQPDKVHKLVLLDSLGPYTDQTVDVLPQLRKAVEKAASLKPTKLAVYPNLDKAAAVRMLGVGKISKPAATLLVERGLRSVEGGYSWTSDPKLMEPSLVRFSEEQVKAVYQGIECPVQLICGEQGYFSAYESLEKRLSYIHNLDKYLVQGGHHFHMDGDVKQTARLMNEFLQF